MARRFTGTRLVVASHNEGKVREIRSLLAPFGVETVSAAELNLEVPEETEETFEGNAAIKAQAAAAASGLPALSDDSGLEIDALGGRPGVHTADWAETPSGRDFRVAMERAWTEVEGSGAPPPHRARFVSCLVLAWPDGHREVFLGTAPGHVVWPPRWRAGIWLRSDVRARWRSGGPDFRRDGVGGEEAAEPPHGRVPPACGRVFPARLK